MKIKFLVTGTALFLSHVFASYGQAPPEKFNYQGIAREDKLMGIDYNRSPTTKYTTSRNQLATKNILILRLLSCF